VTEFTPDVDERDVERILRRDYPEGDIDELRDEIGRLEARFKWRVVVACLKIARGDVASLRRQLHDAPGYYRELMAEAESPRATKMWSRIEKLPEDERQAIHDGDRRQYEEWLRK
jgi:hypothetical protein